jgi:hypothetical protein
MAEQFEWTSPSGVVVQLPHAATLKVGVLRKVRKLDAVDATLTILEAVCDEDALAAIDGLDVGELNDLVAAWQGAALPESSPSST